jgi:hypothetical protein
MGLALLLSACATTKVNWPDRVGNFTFDQAVLDMGPPDKDATLKDGTRVSEWLTSRGRFSNTYVGGWGRGYMMSQPTSPDYYLRLTFDPTGKLQAFKKYAK